MEKSAIDAFPKPLLPFSVTIAGQPAEILYAGAAPCLVAGVMQVNVRLPPDTPSGPAVVLLQVRTRKNQTVSTVAVQ
jgi:uncharacterized protein (TIGR03437 family)